MVGHLLERIAHRVERVCVALFAVGGEGVAVEGPCIAPVDALVCLAGFAADDEDGSLTGRLTA